MVNEMSGKSVIDKNSFDGKKIKITKKWTKGRCFEKIDEYFAIVRKHSRHLSIKEKFNGDVVGRLTDLSGKELGAFMSAFRKVFTDRDLEMMSSLAIESEIVNFSRGFDL